MSKSPNTYRKFATAATAAVLLIMNLAPTASAASLKDLTVKCVKALSYIFDNGKRTNQEEKTESNLIFHTDLSDFQQEKENNNINIDTETPSINSSNVENNAQLVVTFDKEIRDVKKFSKKDCLIFRSVDEYGMETVTKLWKPSVQKVSGTGNQIQIDLTGLADQMDYELSLPEGMVTFMNNEQSGSEKAFFRMEEDKSAVNIVEQIHQHSPGEITITLNGPVVKEEAENVRNFEVEGTAVKSAELTENNSAGAVIVLKLSENTVEESGRYDVTVQPLNSSDSWTLQNAETIKTVYLRENVVPKLHSVGFPNISNDSLEVVLTFSEEVKAGIESDFDLVVDGKSVSEKNNVRLMADINSTGTQLVAKWERDANYEEGLDLVNAESILLAANDSIALKDLNGNITNVDQIIIK